MASYTYSTFFTHSICPLAKLLATACLSAITVAAEAVAKPHNLDLIEMDDLIEINLGNWQGLHASEIIKKWPDMWKQSRVDPSVLSWPNGESFEQTAQRSVQAFNTIVEANQGKLVAVVTHNIIVRIIAMHVLGISYSTYRRMEIGNASFTKIIATDNKYQLVTLNDTSHLGY